MRRVSDRKLKLPGTAAPRPVQVMALVTGFLMIAAGTVAVFVSSNSTGTAALIAAAVLLIAVGIWGDRVESIEAPGVRLGIRPADTLIRAAEADLRGEPAVAAELRVQAEAQLEEAIRAAAKYENIRGSMGSSSERTALLGEVVHQARRLGTDVNLDKSQVESLYNESSDGNRIIALAMIQANGNLANLRILLDALEHPHSSFEQYHALVAAEAAISSKALQRRETETLLERVKRVKSNGGFGLTDSDRNRQANRVIQLLTGSKSSFDAELDSQPRGSEHSEPVSRQSPSDDPG